MTTASCNHSVFFYLTDSEFPDALHQFFTSAVQSGNPMVLIMTPHHRNIFETYMRSHYLSPNVMRSANLLVQADAEEVLNEFWTPGRLDAQKFKMVVGGILTRTRNFHAGRMLWAYGEMVDVLRSQGYHKDALDLEALWNDLALEIKFSLLCGYHLDLTTDNDSSHFINCVCEHHSHVLPLPKCEIQSKRLQQLLNEKFGSRKAEEAWAKACAERENLPQYYSVLLWLRDKHPEIARCAFDYLQAERITA